MAMCSYASKTHKGLLRVPNALEMTTEPNNSLSACDGEDGRVRKGLSPGCLRGLQACAFVCLPLCGIGLYGKTKILPRTVTSRALLARFHGTLANSARPEKACFHKIWGEAPQPSLGFP